MVPDLLKRSFVNAFFQSRIVGFQDKNHSVDALRKRCSFSCHGVQLLEFIPRLVHGIIIVSFDFFSQANSLIENRIKECQFWQPWGTSKSIGWQCGPNLELFIRIGLDPLKGTNLGVRLELCLTSKRYHFKMDRHRDVIISSIECNAKRYLYS